MRKIANNQHVADVVRRIYAEAQELDWEHCTHREHTDQYARWLEDPGVGGVLSQWMAPEDQRVWLKDGPMKEFARALAGEGPFACYLTEHPRSPKQVVRRLLGDAWAVIPGSTAVKPLQCDASSGDQRVRLYWGPAKDFRHLLWAALDQTHRSPSVGIHMVVFDSATRPLSDAECKKLNDIAERCRLPFSLIRL